MKQINFIQLLSLFIAFILSFSSQSIIFYVTTPEISNYLGITHPNGQINSPFTSISQTLYDLPEASEAQIWISSHNHSLECLAIDTCNECDPSEILRASNLNKNPMKITIQTIDCQTDEQNRAMCFNSQDQATLFVKNPNLHLRLNGDSLTIKHLTLSGKSLSQERYYNQCTSNIFLIAERAFLDFQQVNVQNFILGSSNYLSITSGVARFSNFTLFNVITSSSVFSAKDSSIDIINSNFIENSETVLYSIQSLLYVA